jgi:cyclase
MRLSILPPLLLAALVSAPSPAAAQPASPSPSSFTLHEVGPGVWAAVAVPGKGAGSNAGFVIGDTSVAVIDTFQSADSARELLAAIRERTQLPIRFVVNTHYHLDHVAGNGVFREAGATIVAQKNVRAWERTENLKWWGASIPPDRKAWVESLVLPDLVFDDGVELFLGDRRLIVRSLPGHTGSDSIVEVPDAGVVFTGDLFWNRTLPNTTDADTTAWVVTDDRLVADSSGATFVPGHGEVGRAADVRAFRGFLEDLRAAVTAARGRGLAGDALVTAARSGLEPRYAGWAFYGHFVADDIRQTAAELAGTKRLPPG